MGSPAALPRRKSAALPAARRIRGLGRMRLGCTSDASERVNDQIPVRKATSDKILAVNAETSSLIGASAHV